ncbi:hypothetical protein ACFT9I_00485 [Streptomyces sp. NPDC057137]|uniref:hypothetical protein n=1 Tax=Streptomyces sp. NPDC057137 TaxID=3346030 RepID=UPI00362EB518
MAEGHTETPYTDTDTYTSMARARLEMAFAAYELTELARSAVPIGEHELNPGSAVRPAGSPPADAAQVLAAARRFYEAAATFERFRTDPLSAEENASSGANSSTEACGEASWWRSYLTVAPLEAARDLDEWVLRHRDGDPDLGTAPVSGGLVRRTGG